MLRHRTSDVAALHLRRLQLTPPCCPSGRASHRSFEVDRPAQKVHSWAHQHRPRSLFKSSNFQCCSDSVNCELKGGDRPQFTTAVLYFLLWHIPQKSKCPPPTDTTEHRNHEHDRFPKHFLSNLRLISTALSVFPVAVAPILGNTRARGPRPKVLLRKEKDHRRFRSTAVRPLRARPHTAAKKLTQVVPLLSWNLGAVHIVSVVKERTSLVSTPSLAELYRFAMNFLLERKMKRKWNRDGRKRGKLKEKVKAKRPHTRG